MTQLETVRVDAQSVQRDAALPRTVTTATTRGALLGGAVVSVAVGLALLVLPSPSLPAVGALLGAHAAVQGVLQLVRVQESPLLALVRWLLAAGALVVILLAAAMFRGYADSVFLLGLWTGFSWLLRGFAMAVSTTPASVSHVFVYDDLLNAVIVSAGLFMTAFPFSSLGQLVGISGALLIVVGLMEALSAARRRPQALRALD
ncbi:DUF308 domain-containing protein [Streptomyces sp. NPDC057694]|uniref:DUF308 domain-containing protein n=1 Tax=Streptomyces sp. NPDC057694 TaxID=3346216 RepID=UPI0036C0B227